MAIQRWGPSTGSHGVTRPDEPDVRRRALAVGRLRGTIRSARPAGSRHWICSRSRPAICCGPTCPGVAANDVEIQVEDGTLILRGERKMDSGVSREAYLRVEPSLRSLRRPGRPTSFGRAAFDPGHAQERRDRDRAAEEERRGAQPDRDLEPVGTPLTQLYRSSAGGAV